MIQKDNSIVNHYVESDQVSFIDIASQLWRGIFIVIVSVVVALIIATAYIFFAKEKWISTAIITQPDAGQISNYTHSLSVVYGGSDPKISEIQQLIISRVSSALSALSESLNNQQEPERLTIEAATKNQELPLKITYTGSSAEMAQKALAQYIQQVDTQVGKELSTDLASTIQKRKVDLSQFLVTQEKVAKEQKDLRMAQITQALTIAQSANIKVPQMQQAEQVSQDTMFMLGSDALESMIKNEASRPLPFSDSYYQTRQSLFDVMNLELGENGEMLKAGNIQTYRYVMKPTLPIRRDSPKSIMTLILAMLLGGLIGSIIVLARNALHAHKVTV